MKTDNLVILAMVGTAAYLLTKKSGAVSAVSAFAKEITVPGMGNLQPGDAGYGWHYYDNGVSIDASGNYYKDGKLVWLNPAGGVAL